MWPLERFEQIDPGHGTIDRRRTCTPCVTAVDDQLRAGQTNLSAIAREIGVSIGLVRERRDLLGVKPRTYRRLDDIDMLTELTLARTPVADIATQLDVEPHTVRRQQRKLGLRESSTRQPIDGAILARAEQMLREDSASYPEVARTLGISADALRRHFPGYSWTDEDRSTMASILQTPDLKRLHEAFFGGTTTAIAG